MSGPIIRSRSSRQYTNRFSAAFGGDAASKKTARTKSTVAKKDAKSAKKKT